MRPAQNEISNFTFTFKNAIKFCPHQPDWLEYWNATNVHQHCISKITHWKKYTNVKQVQNIAKLNRHLLRNKILNKKLQ